MRAVAKFILDNKAIYESEQTDDTNLSRKVTQSPNKANIQNSTKTNDRYAEYIEKQLEKDNLRFSQL